MNQIKKCSDLRVFQQEPVQALIDFKWRTFGFQFYLVKQILIGIVISVFMADTGIFMKVQKGSRVFFDSRYSEFFSYSLKVENLIMLGFLSTLSIMIMLR
mmetsp:Transcript_31020/g.47422  ORF Transcript_31020/g.47422 Transcript_31020/m.47422 type:complete len:100 (+) Transcript_31020:638-937(+)